MRSLFICLVLVVAVISQTVADTVVIRRTGGESPLVCSAGNTLAETFDDATDYDEASLVEDVGSGTTMDPNDTTRTETYFANEDLKILSTLGAVGDNYMPVSNLTESWDSFVFYISSEDFDNTELDAIYVQWSATDGWGLNVQLAQISDALQLQLYNGSATALGTAYGITVNNVYVVTVHFKADGANDEYDWWVWDAGSDGSEATTTADHTNSGTADIIDNIDRAYSGMIALENHAITIYFGLWYIDTTGHPCE